MCLSQRGKRAHKQKQQGANSEVSIGPAGTFTLIMCMMYEKNTADQNDKQVKSTVASNWVLAQEYLPQGMKENGEIQSWLHGLQS